MSRRENRRKKREEKAQETEYASLADSYNATRDQLDVTARRLHDAQLLHDRESQDLFRQKIRELWTEYTKTRDKLGLNEPAELVIQHNGRWTTNIEGTVRDWLVANYNLTGRVDKNAREKGILLENGFLLPPGRWQYGGPWRGGVIQEYRNVGIVKPTLLKKDGAFTLPSQSIYEYKHEADKDYYEMNGMVPFKPKTKSSQNTYFTSKRIHDETAYRPMPKKEAVELIRNVANTPAYKNKIRITAKLVYGGGI